MSKGKQQSLNKKNLFDTLRKCNFKVNSINFLILILAKNNIFGLSLPSNDIICNPFSLSKTK